ncbi:MAG: hypothetical protein HZB61_15725 [Nitrospirae bacterium]|nr:hypothetical protein [Nitrospirota bacterium]
MENIFLIASVISALTAVTTSLRALGKSREYARDNSKSDIQDSCRIAGCGKQETKSPGLWQHILVTAIWFVLSVVLALPSIIQRWQTHKGSALLLWVPPLLLLIVLLWYIWRKVFNTRGD